MHIHKHLYLSPPLGSENITEEEQKERKSEMNGQSVLENSLPGITGLLHSRALSDLHKTNYKTELITIPS